MSSDISRATLDDVKDVDFTVSTVGKPTMSSPVAHVDFIGPDERISYLSKVSEIEKCAERGVPIPGFEPAGPREMIYHDPAWTRAAIVNCGGLCPGLNDVIKAIVTTLWNQYGVRNIFGIRYGYRGLVPSYKLDPIQLTPDVVDLIHEEGGSLLGSSRGYQPEEEIVKTLVRLQINILFTIGGDGTQRGARDIARVIQEQGAPISVIGIPKTIDNDISFMDRTFGYETAVYAAAPVIASAHNEAKGVFNGIGLVKLMGRESGFIAAAASLANSVANFVLIPEDPFKLEGKKGLLRAIERRLEISDHIVIVVAEGAGQELMKHEDVGQDPSGNNHLKDIGLFLKEKISAYLAERKIDYSIKYFDPSYLVRSVPARGTDAIFCLMLGTHAAHAGMAGKTAMVVGHWNGQFTHVPVDLAVMERRKINPSGALWKAVLGSTQQHQYFD
ncbi:MAG: ATP-dependent 6-phosphofructokinase [Lentisphaeria bacterium]|nr:ATP-dependent 6-phosphofructokinase [Lentisphaeria bacterium]